MNENKKTKNIIISLVGAAIIVLGGFSFILERLIDLYPDVIREKFGDKFVEWLLDLPLPYIVLISILVFIVIFGYLLWFNGVFETKNKGELPNKNSESLWDSKDKSKKNKKYKVSLDVHKSENWKNDGNFFLCVHNESFFIKLWDLSVVVTGIFKIENGSSNVELGRSAILNESFHLGNRRSYVDLPFIEVSKDANKFSIFVKHQEEVNGQVVQYEFQPGEYIINVVVKKLVLLEKPKASPVIPIRIKYDGFDRIECKIDFLAMIDYRLGKFPSSSAVFLQ